MQFIYTFDKDTTDEQMAEATREFTSRIIDKVALYNGTCYWLYSAAGCRVGTVKIISLERSQIENYNRIIWES